jgi:hypothetical protein
MAPILVLMLFTGIGLVLLLDEPATFCQPAAFCLPPALQAAGQDRMCDAAAAIFCFYWN